MKKYLVTYGKPRFLGIVSLDDEQYDSIKKERLIVAASHRGDELAEVVGLLDGEQEREYRNLKTISEHGEGPVRGGDPVVTDLDFVRVPTPADIEENIEQVESSFEILRTAQELVDWHKLQIKLIDAEMLIGGKKLFFYFTADQRVDFRTLVKDLARRFKTRIELRQMGVRDEARIIKGLSSCGLPCCCSYWLNQFAPIGIKMVKEQNIALNPAKISGICGRLMCCMSFEHRVYKDMWAGLPGPGSKIKTPKGNFIVAAMDLAREAVRCHRPMGGDITVPIKLFAEFKEAVMNGEDWELPEGELSEFDKRKQDCAKCRSGFAMESYSFGEFKSDKPAAHQAAATPEKRDGAQEKGEDGEEKKRRRRGRRGGRNRHDGDRAERAEPAERPAGAGKPKTHQKPRNPEPQAAQRTAAQKPETGDTSESAVKKPRRRRRRPGRPRGNQNGTEAKQTGGE